jgi:effector-binding domain-containing protein
VDYEVTVTQVEPQPTAVVAATTTGREFPSLWKQLLDEVWGCLRAGGVTRGCRNVMLYRDGEPAVGAPAVDVLDVEVGVLLTQACPLTGNVVASALPGGTVAKTVHRGHFGDLRSAYEALATWRTTHGHPSTGTRWEIYGPHNDDPAQQWTEVYWLLP